MPLKPPPAPVDRVRVINRSMRCFIFGIVGIVPWFGIGMACLAFKLFLEVAEETGEAVKVYPLFITTVSGLAVCSVCFVEGMPDQVLIAGLAMLALQFFFLRQQYARNAPSEWNAARHLVYWGIAMANLGIVLSAAVALLVIYALKS